jgi:hypothetical protein
VGSAELPESLGPQAIDDIPIGHYLPLAEFSQDGFRLLGLLCIDGDPGSEPGRRLSIRS